MVNITENMIDYSSLDFFKLYFNTGNKIMTLMGFSKYINAIHA